MAVIILDADGWQNVIDFETGENIESWDDPQIDKLLSITPLCPYPGDISMDSIEWTTDVAQNVTDAYDPDFLLITFATPSFIKKTQPLSPQETAEINRRMFAAVSAFVERNDYEPFIIGTGGMQPIRATIEPPHLRGRLIRSSESFPYGAIFHAAPQDYIDAANIPHATVYTKEEMRACFPEMSQSFYDKTADIMLMCEDGYAFSSAGSRGMTRLRISRLVRRLPVYTRLPLPEHITGVRAVLDAAMDEGKKVALIVLEATSAEEFALPYREIACDDQWMVYDQGLTQYAALLTGKPFYKMDWPLVNDPKSYDLSPHRYPYSQFMDEMPRDVIGRRPDKRTAAVGSRSMFTHVLSMADICIECHARQMAPGGVLGLINDPK